MPPTSQSRGEALIVTVHQELGRDLRSELEAEGWQTVVTNSVGPARKLLKRDSVGLLIVDEESLPDVSSQLGERLRLRSDEIALLLLATREGRQARTVKGLEPLQIIDVPLRPEQLGDALAQFDRKRQVKKGSKILGRSEAVQQIREIVAQIAPIPVSVLVTGESGTGKNLVAEAIHQLSPRRNARMITVNCGAIPESLLESELFGHEKGAFTDARTQRQGIFEAADGGTVFLDEIGEMSLSAQVRLLRVLEAREITRLGSTRPITVDVRVIAATNRDLQQAVAEGKFRRDLYYRLKVVEIPIPPLRSRPEDIPILLDRFIQEYMQEHNVPPIELDAQSMALLESYRWPGNVRELSNLVERLMVLSVNRKISAADIAAYLEDLDRTAPSGYGNPNLPVYLGKTPEESHHDLLLYSILEVARDIKEMAREIKEMKAFVMGNQAEVRSLPVFQPEEAAFAEEDTEVEYAEADVHPPAAEEIKPIREVEKEAIIRALRAMGGHRKRAAKLLDMPERTLYRKIRQYNLT